MRERVLVVAPVLSGKSTWIRHNPKAPVLESDGASTPELKAVLKPLRHAGKWAEHNAIWYPAVADWLAHQDPARWIVLVHHPEIGTALRLPVVATVVVPTAEFDRRMRDADIDVDRKRMAVLNRQGVIEDWMQRGTPAFSSVGAAIVHVLAHGGGR